MGEAGQRTEIPSIGRKNVVETEMLQRRKHIGNPLQQRLKMMHMTILTGDIL
jgi:hypothetical protein